LKWACPGQHRSGGMHRSDRSRSEPLPVVAFGHVSAKCPFSLHL
jgi:hypothetical protein